MALGPDTIVAVATPRGRGAIGIVRLSGPASLASARRLAPRLPPKPLPRHAYWTPLLDGVGLPLDEGLVLYFPPDGSATGEAVVELHSHGSPAVQAVLLEALLVDDQVRLADPGEFAERAFRNGRLDLLRAEAVADLIAAEGTASARAAASQLGGALGAVVQSVREALVELQADLEALLEFPEEAAEAEVTLGDRLASARAEVGTLLASARRGRLLRARARVVLAGPVNAGKSSLFNRLAGEERALVDAAPGTTRDVLEAAGELDGLAVTWVDTAGLGSVAAQVEALGVERARGEVRRADVLLRVLPAGTPEAERLRWQGELVAPAVVDVASKVDLATPRAEEGLGVSAWSGEGIEALEARVLQVLRAGGVDAAGPAVSERHAEALARADLALGRAELGRVEGALELASAEVTASLDALGELTGESAAPAVLEAIFRRFCIGK